ncbi:MAG: hypothetical protein A3B89_01690 [Candidatus Buchananbacteria bacterium RIFCSPHIGHO2_02_FULL_40_13]|uniref:Uncharacterized protein n=1 Tax=Candidatus Buchananbacteria bacterium RIFCSPLOWO2_01_FULL_39_33 TaxID=1797543 RepID=A0A1G1YIT6_9BACT|nr:MAG: hypothetical protein A3B89_01690 [Candidatus Buchananbacteria bacterium RIFCSPHIGHO2_02_FULL_40_13]OGY52258.1 MAG: hypothetical protein A3A02_01640 [Candidatus Buchananbacteria bacterium RIFCSPLOWO2_01_FULL_39_33]
MVEEKYQKIWEPIDFTVYFKFIKWPVIIGLILEILFRFWAVKIGSGILYEQVEIISWIIRLGIFVNLAIRSTKHFGFSAPIAMISGVMSGALIGFIISLYRFIDGVKLWKFFNIITETSMVAVVGSLVAILIVYVSNLKR